MPVFSPYNNYHTPNSLRLPTFSLTLFASDILLVLTSPSFSVNVLQIHASEIITNKFD